MVYLKCIGRVGVLGVALGIGAGLAATPWAAYTKPSESDSPSSDSASSASEAPSASSPSSSSSATGDTTTTAPTHTTGPPNPDCASCVEQFNIAVGTPGEYQRVFHQGKLGRDVSYFARIPKQDCPF
jgi:cytoskeletal protein RodZ